MAIWARATRRAECREVERGEREKQPGYAATRFFATRFGERL
jgi:hypothetical protein